MLFGRPFGLTSHKLRGRSVYLNRPSERLAFRRRGFAPLRYRMTPTNEGDALTGHFRADKNIALWGYLYFAVSPVVAWLSLLKNMTRKREALHPLSLTHQTRMGAHKVTMFFRMRTYEFLETLVLICHTGSKFALGSLLIFSNPFTAIWRHKHLCFKWQI